MSSQIINLLESNCRGLYLAENEIKDILSMLIYDTYSTLSENEKQSIFELSQTYIVKYKEDKSGISLSLYSRPREFHYKEVDKLQTKTNKIHKNEIVYSSWFNDIDIRSIVIPNINVLKYNCICRDSCECRYTNLPIIKEIQNLIICKGKKSITIADSKMYAKYLAIPPKYLYMLKYIDDNLDILHDKYIMDLYDLEKESKFWANLIRYSGNVYIMNIYNTNDGTRFPFNKKIKSVMKDIILIKCRYYPCCLTNIDNNINDIQIKLQYFGINTNINIKYCYELNDKTNMHLDTY